MSYRRKIDGKLFTFKEANSFRVVLMADGLEFPVTHKHLAEDFEVVV